MVREQLRLHWIRRDLAPKAPERIDDVVEAHSTVPEESPLVEQAITTPTEIKVADNFADATAESDSSSSSSDDESTLASWHKFPAR